jgi:hypothetical protein
VHCLKLADVGGAPLLLAKRAKRTRARAHTRAYDVCETAKCLLPNRIASLPAQMATLPLPCRTKGIIGPCRSLVCYHQWHRRECPFAPFSWFILPLRLSFVMALARLQVFFACVALSWPPVCTRTHTRTPRCLIHFTPAPDMFSPQYGSSTIASPKGGGIEVLLNGYSQRQTA